MEVKYKVQLYNLGKLSKIETSLFPKGNIIFIHGFSSSHILHSLFEQNNNFQDYNYYAFDLFGHNKDDFLFEKSTERQNYKIKNYILQLLDFINKNKLENLIIIGHSMGGALAAQVYDVIKEKVKAIILVSPINLSIYNSKIGVNYLTYTFINSVKNLKKIVFHNIENIPSEINGYIEFEIKKFLKNKKKYLHLGFNLIELSYLLKINDLFKKIQTPTLVILSENDKVIPYKKSDKYFKKMNKQNFIIKSIKESGHICFVEQFKIYNEMVWDFILNLEKKNDNEKNARTNS